MSSFELNKIAMALLLTVLLVFGINGLTDMVFEEEQLLSDAYPIETETAETEVVVEKEVPVGPSLPELLAEASVEDGKSDFKKCKACHTAEQGGRHLVGPNLWNVVGRPKGTAEDYSYSSSMEDAGGAWTYEDLNEFLKSPGNFIRGTKMSFVGLKKASDRADVIRYLRTLSADPVPLPEADAPEAAAEPDAEEDAAEEAAE